MEAKKLTQHLGAFSACISAMAVGTTMGWTSAAGSLQDTKNEFHIDDDEFSWVGAMLSVGAIIGAIPLGALANMIGRKKVIIFLAPFMVGGYLLLAWANTVWMLYIARLILGAVTGAYCVVTPMYTGEIAENSIRGTLGSYFQLLITGGIFFVYVLNALKIGLFWVNIACACIPVVMVVMLLRFPDTPRWFVSKNKIAEADASLKFFRGSKYNVEEERETIQQGIDEERNQQLPCSKAFTTPAAKKGLFLALTVMIFQQFSGINAVIFYSSQIFEDAHAGMEPSTSTVMVGAFQITATAVSSFLIDRLGRKPLLILSGSVMAVSGALLGLYFCLDKNGTTKEVSLGWLPMTSMIVFIVVFSVGYGPIPWLYMGEVFSDQIKETGMSIATVVNWVSVFVVTKYHSGLKQQIGADFTFWLFSAISLLGCFFTFFCVLETKGKSQTQIIAELGGSGIDEISSNGTLNANDKRKDIERF